MPISAQQAYDEALPGDAVIGWKLDRAQRAELLARLPPTYPQVVADHVTLRSKVARDSRLPSEIEAEIIGRADDEKGVEAMVVSLGGASGRPDGSTYHITWSLDPGRQARESNDVIAAYGWTSVEPIQIRLIPDSFFG